MRFSAKVSKRAGSWADAALSSVVRRLVLRAQARHHALARELVEAAPFLEEGERRTRDGGGEA